MAYEENYNTYSNNNGVVNLPAIMGLGAAIRHLDAAGMEKVEAHNLALRNRLADRLGAIEGLTIVSPPAGELVSPLVTVLLAERFERRSVVAALLELHQVAIRPTHAEFGFNGIRFSIHEFNTDADIDRAADAVRRELGA
jgi:cysteine desulfurase/selenocysteine lyase